MEASKRLSLNLDNRLFLDVLSSFTLILYTLELIINRTLYRVLVFMPPFISARISGAVDLLGRAFIDGTLVSSIAMLLASGVWWYTGTVLGLAVLDYAGVGPVKLYYALLLPAALAVYVDRRRALEALLLALMVLYPLTGEALLFYAASIAWLLAPLPFISSRNKWTLKYTVPLALLLLYALFKNPYIMSQVFIFSMNLATPWLLPLAVVLYPLAYSTGRLTLLLTGPIPQLSNQILVIAAGYIHDYLDSNGGR